MNKLLKMLCFAAIAVVLTSCGKDSSSTTAETSPAPAAVEKPMETVAPRPAAVTAAPAITICADCGTVNSITAITVPAAQTSGAGAAVGAIVGGLLGNQVGEGKGKDAATVVGAVGGAVVGNTVEKNRNASTVYDVQVAMEDGSSQTIRVPEIGSLSAGQKVRVSGTTILPR